MTSPAVLIFCVAWDVISDVVGGGHEEEDESVMFVGFFVSLPFFNWVQSVDVLQ